MIRAIRPNAMAQDDAALISGWNLSPNVAYVAQLNPGASACGVLLYSEDQTAIIASGAGIVGTDQPVILHPYYGQTIGMIDAELGWHLLLTTDGTEYPRTVRIGPAVDLPDEIHPIYADDDLAVVRATAGVDDHAHYIDDISVTCPLGLGAGLGDVVSVPVDGASVAGQVESITWTATPSGASDAVVVRRHVAIAPEPWVDPVPIVAPTVADDEAETDAETEASGNVLENDEAGLTVVAVNGLSASVGVAVEGSDGGTFTVDADGSWTFDPNGDFATLEGSETADTSVTYHASDGVSEAMATLTVTVSSGAAVLWTPGMIYGAVWLDADTVTLDGSAVTAMTDKAGGTLQATQGTSTARPTLVADALGTEDVIQFDGGDFLSFGTILGKPANWSIFVVGMFDNLPTGANACMCGSIDSVGTNARGWGRCLAYNGQSWYNFGNGSAASYGYYASAFSNDAWFMEAQTYTSGDNYVRQYLNGVEKTPTKSATAATACSGTAYEYALGRHGAFGQYASNGTRLKGWLMVPGVLSTGDRQKLEGYYAHRCGLAGLLSSGHPYKSAAPTV